MKSTESWKTEKNINNEIDVVITKNIELSTEIEKIRLRLENKLRLFLGEWFLHNKEGMSWIKRNQNNGQIGNLLQRFNIETQVRETILNDKDVKDISDFVSNFDNITGNYSFKIEILLKNGEVLNL